MLLRKTTNLNEYCLYRRQQIAEKMSNDICELHNQIKPKYNQQYLFELITEQLRLCPACYQVGTNWQEIMRNCLTFLFSKNDNQHPECIKLRMLIRTTYPIKQKIAQPLKRQQLFSIQ